MTLRDAESTVRDVANRIDRLLKEGDIEALVVSQQDVLHDAIGELDGIANQLSKVSLVVEKVELELLDE